MKFTEEKLEEAIIQLLGEQGFSHSTGADIKQAGSDILIKEDLRKFLFEQYSYADITAEEIEYVCRNLESLSTGDLYESNKSFCKWLSDGFLLKREDYTQKDLYIQLIDYSDLTQLHQPNAEDLDLIGDKANEPQKVYQTKNVYKIVSQPEIIGEGRASII